MKDIKLTKQQAEYLPAIQWLLSDENRAAGRSFLLAYVYVLKGLQNPGKKIYVRDHFPTRQADVFLMHTVERILKTDKEIQKAFKCTFYTDGFKVDYA